MRGDLNREAGRIVHLRHTGTHCPKPLGPKSLAVTEAAHAAIGDRKQAEWRPEHAAEYLSELISECAVMAEKSGCTTLAALLRQAVEEAQHCITK